MPSNRLSTNMLRQPSGPSKEFEGSTTQYSGTDDSGLESVLSADGLTHLREEGALAQAGYEPFDLEAYRHGDLTPVYFGSALKLFGVTELLDALTAFAPPPREQPAEPEPISPERGDVTGFIFKVQAKILAKCPPLAFSSSGLPSSTRDPSLNTSTRSKSSASCGCDTTQSNP